MTYGNETMHKALFCLGEVPYCIWRSSTKFQGHMAKKTSILKQIGSFRTVTQVWIHPWLWNDAQSLKQHSICGLLFFKVICQISRPHGQKIADFDPNWGFLDRNSSLNWLMAMKLCTKLDDAEDRCPIFFSRSSAKFQGHTAKQLSILTQIGRFRTVTSVWIHWWLWNDAHSLKQHRRGALLFFKVIRKISRSHRTKTLTQFEIEVVPYCFSKSFVKFRGHTVQKIADFDPNWAFPDFNSSLNSLMAMTWCTKLDIVEKRCPIVSSRSSIKFRITWVAKSTIWILFE